MQLKPFLKDSLQKVNPLVFWPPFVLLLAAAIMSLISDETLASLTKSLQDWILFHFDWLFNWVAFIILCVVLAIYFSPHSRLRIGGKNARPQLSLWKWFVICLCTTVATGILFWGTAEPLYHLHSPGYAEMEPYSHEAAKASISSVYLHWSFIPYGIYTLAALAFALSFYNHGQPFRVSSLLYPLTGGKTPRALATAIDGVCLFSLATGMAASLGTGILTISGGLEKLFDLQQTPVTLAFIAVAVVITFVLSSISGLMRGIRVLSDINMRMFIAVALFVLLFGPTRAVLDLSGDALVTFLTRMVPQSLGVDPDISTSWTHSWTTFYWANWMAWTPVTALFLGRLGRGYSVKRFIEFNLFLPSIFGLLWMSIFSGSAVHMDMTTDNSLSFILLQSGPENVIYSLFEQLPLGQIISMVFVAMIFLSFVTAADSNTSAMSGLSSEGITVNHQEAPNLIKLIWGLIIGSISLAMISYTGIEGVKTLSVLGGFPALVLLFFVLLGMVKLFLLSGPTKVPK